MSANTSAPHPTPAQMTEHFEKLATTYEDNNGGVTNAMCRQLLRLCGPSGPFPSPLSSASIIHDNASGPGILADEILKLPEFSSGDIPKIYCTDISPAMIKVLEAKGWGSKYGVEASVMDAQTLSFPDESFTHSFMNLGIFALSEPSKGTKEINRTLKPGGLAFVTTFNHTGWLPPFQRAQKRVRPGEEPWQGMLSAEWSELSHIHKLMLDGGFADANIRIESFSVPFEMKRFVEKQGQIIALASGALTKGWSEDEVAKFDEVLKEEMKVEIESDKTEIGIWIAIAKK